MRDIVDLCMVLMLLLENTSTIRVFELLMKMYYLNHVLALKKYGSLICKKRFLIFTLRKRGLSEIFLRKYLRIFPNFQDRVNYEI